MADNDEIILRELAEKVAEVAALPEQEQKRRMWYEHNALRSGRPTVLVFPEGSWVELLPDSQLQCQDPLLRSWERELRMRVYTWEHFKDDQPVDNRLQVGCVHTTTGYGLEAERIHSDTDRGAYTWDPPIKEPQDLDKLQTPHTEVDYGATQRNRERAEDIFAGLLAVSVGQSWFWSLTLTSRR